jgi:L-aminopeptidase/D-esterase-like protein
MGATGKNNAITDVQGILVGHFTDLEAASGVTAVICPEDAVAGVDVRGSAPGTRETDLLDPINLVQKVQAVVLSGGSCYGLAAADGVLRRLADRSRGFPVEGGHVVPIVPAAVLYDLGRGNAFVPPIGPDWGSKAFDAAAGGPVPTGSVGAGTGAVAGGIKGGLGTASCVLPGGITVAALVAVNSLGSVVDPGTGRPWEIRLQVEEEFGETGRRAVRLPDPPASAAGRNTTLGVAATDAILTKAQAQKVAQMAHDGLARAIRPSHTMFDGDTIFCLATGRRDLPDAPGFFADPGAESINVIGAFAADCMTRAVIRAVVEAKSLAGFTAFRDLPER